ncbi:MAG: aminotransferase class V-fold PLP-dependent enzyme [Chloroflexi bacterium]|nr:aminotransferase class V-fold PLP-dependent enzyme [Chloroflexota bacterium]
METVIPDLEDALHDENLDPDWDSARRLGHQMVDAAIDYLATIEERPVWQPPPPEVIARLSATLPQEPQPAEQVFADFRRDVLPYNQGTVHPRYWGWVKGSGTVIGAFADFLAATMNPNVGGLNIAPVYVEYQVLDWLKEIVGYPREAGGLLVSGGSEANFVGLAVARHAHTQGRDREEGLTSHRPLVAYMSSEGHSSLQKAVEILGLGNRYLRRVPVDENYRIRIDELEKMINADRNAGLQPFCVIGNAGTVNTGAIDPLSDLADFAQEQGLWFHVDGAIGAVANLSPRLRPLLVGMERADSIGLDAHKWLHINYQVGCSLVRDRELQRSTFRLIPPYLERPTRGIGAGPEWPSEYGLQLSRGFMALKVWMSLKEHGAKKYARVIEKNVAQAQYLEQLIEASPRLKLLAPVSLNIVCFRYQPEESSEEKLKALNQELLLRLQESGQAIISSTTLGEKFALRACFTNHRTRKKDVELLVDLVEKIGRDLA